MEKRRVEYYKILLNFRRAASSIIEISGENSYVIGIIV